MLTNFLKWNYTDTMDLSTYVPSSMDKTPPQLTAEQKAEEAKRIADRRKELDKARHEANSKQTLSTPDNRPPQPVQTPAYSGIKRCYDLMTPEVRQTLDAIEVETLAEKRVAAQMGYDAARSKMEAADRTLALQVVAADDMMTFSNKYDAAIDETRKRRIEHQLNETPLSGSAETAGNALLSDLTPRKLLG